jgi:uncharacterized protein with von Willebrand factor type A (vWA) domain
VSAHQSDRPPARPGGQDQLGRTYLQSLVAFGRLCRASGLRVSTGQILDLCRALAYIDITNRAEFYQTARCLLLSRHVDEPLFAALFNRFWLRYRPRPLTDMDRDATSDLLQQAASGAQPGEEAARRTRTINVALDMPDEEAAEAGEGMDAEGGADQLAAYSATELLRQKDFSGLTAKEIAEVRRLIAELRWHAATHKIRRTRRASKGSHPDPRRALRENLSHGGELLTLPRRTPRRKPRPLVLICDISGSMERYTSMLLRFLHALRQGRGGVETFVFGTRLTRITRQLRKRDTDAALADVSHEVLDWGGGTRIGDSLATFNRRWGRRVLGHAATVVVISDGWDRGDPDVLAGELAHLQRLSHRLIWLNPLLGLAGYEPLTRGMRAALPFIDDFMAAHNLASLEALARLLQDLDDRRPERGQHHAPAAPAASA